jgi:hypothetical protein
VSVIRATFLHRDGAAWCYLCAQLDPCLRKSLEAQDFRNYRCVEKSKKSINTILLIDRNYSPGQCQLRQLREVMTGAGRCGKPALTRRADSDMTASAQG